MVRARRSLVVACALGVGVAACAQIFGIEEGHLVAEVNGPDATGKEAASTESGAPEGDARPTDDAAGEAAAPPPGDASADADAPVPAETPTDCSRCKSGGGGCDDAGRCKAEPVVGGVTPATGLELVDGVLYGVVLAQARVWSAPATPAASKRTDRAGGSGGSGGGLAIDGNDIFFGVVAGPAPGVYRLARDSDAGAVLANAGASPNRLVVDPDNARVLGSAAPATLFSANAAQPFSPTACDLPVLGGGLTDFVGRDGHVFWSTGNAIGHSSPSQITAWRDGCIVSTLATGLDVSALAVDRDALYVAYGAGAATGTHIARLGIARLFTCKVQDCASGCGLAPDHCGGRSMCPTCMTGQTCGGGGPNTCGAGNGSPLACAGGECGMIGDGLGGILDCGGCAATAKGARTWCEPTQKPGTSSCTGQFNDIAELSAAPRHLLVRGNRVLWSTPNEIGEVAVDGGPRHVIYRATGVVEISWITADDDYVYFVDEKNDEVRRVSR